MSIKVIVGILYLLTGLVCLYWSIQLTFMGMYGTPFSWWYAAVAGGSLMLILGAILGWTSGQAWTDWVPLVGSGILAAYFIPAIIVTFDRHRQGQAPGGTALSGRAVVVILVLASFAVAASKKLHLTSR